MKKLHHQRPALKKPPTAAGLEFEACRSCGHPVVYCRLAGARPGTRPAAIELAPRGAGNVGISDDLFGGGPHAVELAGTASSYRRHAPHCPGALTHSRFVGKKTR
jgi:hypothetical protein